MARKKRKGAEADAPQETSTAVAEMNTTPPERPAYIDGPPTNEVGTVISKSQSREPEHGKHWGPPYKAIFTCSGKGFEMGEDRRFKQRVFKFREKPEPEVLAELKDNGFTYRPEEKAWTIHADNASRQLTDELAAKFAGNSQEHFR